MNKDLYPDNKQHKHAHVDINKTIEGKQAGSKLKAILIVIYAS